MSKKNRFSVLIIGLVVLLLILYRLIFPHHPPLAPTGPYETWTFIEDYAYSIGERVIPVQFWLPKNEMTNMPVVIFSHGAFGTQKSNESLFLELASHGYKVASIGHTYHSFFSIDASGKKTFMDWTYAREVLSENAHEEKAQSLAYYEKWMAIRMHDIHFIIEALDAENVAVMGHSLGGSAALGIGRSRQDVKAVLALESPFMFDIIGVEEDEFVFLQAPYPVPVLNIYTDSSFEHLQDWPQYRQNYLMLTTDLPAVYNVHIEGAGHLSITDLALTSPLLTRLFNGHASEGDREVILREINQQALEFFNTYLKGDH